MTVFLNEKSRVIVQGITGKQGYEHTQKMVYSGTNIVAGVNPRKAGSVVDFQKSEVGSQEKVQVKVFGTVLEAKEETNANVSVVFVPPLYTKSAVIEAIEAGVELIVVITEGVPVHDSIEFCALAKEKGVRIIGPNCPGIISPGKSNVGITPADITGEGCLGLVSKSGTLTYQLMNELSDFGFTTCVGIGGDPVNGTSHIDVIEGFEKDPDTKLIVMIGEIGGDAEERVAEYVKEHVTKPVVAYIAGFTAPEGKTMGHAGAIISGSSGTAQSKADALNRCGVRVGKTPTQTAEIVKEIMAELA
ncbi:succinate--CoA ligase subunit alpha [Actinomyces sp. zg-332]|uniref:succinate--CoA ligase subunit alpha n=1 Tax=Actinomyces sp. zg-332 TaxID=2708340 RepID=UPI0014237AB7|nr:succinate--CoA ligase subunit alpha [Actinomyces sp. zg-332]QPK93844.1 succinate--CoA ligase subunit alpha [Actinomyces sp. zg-332]